MPLRCTLATPWNGPDVPLQLAPRAHIEPSGGWGRNGRTGIPAAFDRAVFQAVFHVALGSESENAPGPGYGPGLPVRPL
jgi:hypothetical protein